MILWCFASFGLIWQFLGVSKSHVNCSGRHAKKNPKKSGTHDQANEKDPHLSDGRDLLQAQVFSPLIV